MITRSACENKPHDDGVLSVSGLNGAVSTGELHSGIIRIPAWDNPLIFATAAFFYIHPCSSLYHNKPGSCFSLVK